MQPKQWSGSYNEQFRDRRKYVTPYSGYAEPINRTQGYYGPRAALAEHAARTAELQARGLTAPFNLSASGAGGGGGEGGGEFGETGRGGGGGGAGLSSSANYVNNNYFNGSRTARLYDPNSAGFRDKDLWTHPILPLSGTYSNYTSIRGAGIRPNLLNYSSTPSSSSSSQRFDTSDAYVTDPAATIQQHWGNTISSYSTGSQTARGSVSSDGIRYDDNGVAQTKYVDVTRSQEPKVKYYVPGYSGNVRGMQFVHGDTYGKTTRKCLDPPQLPSDEY